MIVNQPVQSVYLSMYSLLFSNVWEDPEIELKLLMQQNFKKKHNQQLKMLMVCSGGDTLVHLLNDFCRLNDKPTNISITVIDSNKLQIALAVLKILLWHFLNTSKSVSILKNAEDKWYMYQSFLTGHCEQSRWAPLIDFLICRYGSKTTYAHFLLLWKQPQNLQLLENGVLFAGQLEQTFSKLIASDMNFEATFNDQELCEKFGQESVYLSRQKSFGKRFESIYQNYIDLYGQNHEENRFYHKLQVGTETISYGIHLFQETTNNFGLPQIDFVCENMFSYLMNAPTQKYDFIQTSNVTDWLETKSNVELFVANVHRSCVCGGVALFRSLNGDYDLEAIATHEQQIHNILSDTSFFYKVTLASEKKSEHFNCTEDIFTFVNQFVNTETTEKNEYFHAIVQDDLNLSSFLTSQIPFFHAVEHWVVVLQKIFDLLILREEHELATLLYQNISDELGKKTGKKHTETFIQFLFAIQKKLGFCNQIDFISAKHIDEFNMKLDFIVNKDSLAYVCSYLGTIEYQYTFISAIIKQFLDRKNIQQEHYEMHEILDTQHAADLYNIAMMLQTDTSDILNGALDATQDFMQVYTSMKQ